MEKKTIIRSILLTLFAILLIYLMSSSMRYEREIDTKLPANILFKEFNVAFTDSSKSQIWPNKISTLKSTGLSKGNQIDIIYSPKILKSRQSYIFTDIKTNEFTYEPVPEHPFAGHTTIKIIAMPQGSRLIWSEEYNPKGISISALYFRLYYDWKFFRELKIDIAHYEADSNNVKFFNITQIIKIGDD